MSAKAGRKHTASQSRNFIFFSRPEMSLRRTVITRKRHSLKRLGSNNYLEVSGMRMSKVSRVANRKLTIATMPRLQLNRYFYLRLCNYRRKLTLIKQMSADDLTICARPHTAT